MDPILGVQHTRPDPKPPPGACDCHTHVFGLPERYPYAPARTYTPGPASTEELLALHTALGIERVVIVQPSVYGTDNRCTLDAVRTLGDRARAVAVVAPDLDRAALRALHDAGVRGIRLNLETAGQHDPAAAKDAFLRAADLVQPLGWHIQTFTNLRVIAALHDTFRAFPVPLVVDHFGGAMAAAGLGQPGLDALLDLVQWGRAYVKLSAPHRSAARPDDAGPIAAALIAANPDRILWGTDWPHPASRPHARHDPEAVEPFDPIDDGQALSRVQRWGRNPATIRAILVDNPARLYGFPTAE